MDLTSVHQGVHRLKKKKRVGRGPGSGHGKTSTRGSKGQWASAGADKPKAGFGRIPKRGFSHATWDHFYLVVNVGDLEKAFADGATVDHDALRKAGLANGPADGIRILGTGDLTKRLVVRAHHFSKSAAEKIKAKGGSADLILPPRKPKRNKMKPRPPKE